LEKEVEADIDEKDWEGLDTTQGFLAARECLKKEKFSEIIEHCDQELAGDGLYSDEARLLRATFYILTKQQDLAMKDLSALIDNKDAAVKLRVNALIKRASLFIQQCKDPSKDPQLSFEDFAKAVELDPENADVYHHRGQVNLLIDELSKAIVDFNKAVELQPNFPVAYVQKLYTDYRAATTASDHKRINNVLGQFQEAIDKFPKCVETYALYAQVMNDQQEFEKADSLYQQGIGVDPSNANLLVHRGLVALQSKGDVGAAVRLIQSALELDEKCEFAYETLGTIEVQRGNLKQAIELFDKAIPLANTELEMGHLFGLRDAAMAQITVSTKLGITLPAMGMMG
jgi:import receptor subunit TOM70